MSGKGKPWAIALGEVMTLLRDMTERGVREQAKLLGMSAATLSRIERGYGCDVEQLVKIHKLSGISYDRLLGSARKPEGGK
jgi:transcriptional regulator with XRE-family HTH domain